MTQQSKSKLDAKPVNRPLRCMFVITSMPVGGAEVLLVNLVRSFNRDRIQPQICCLKEPGELGEQIRDEIPFFSNLISHRYDVAVVKRLRRLFVQQEIDAIVTVGAGDKMFWGRLAARYARVPVVLSALHSTGWPDGVGRLNRMLTRITDGFIAVAGDHKKYMIEDEHFPAEKVFMIPNGIDVDKFKFDAGVRAAWRRKLGIGENDPVCGIVAALRPEKNHQLFLRLAGKCSDEISNAHFMIVGDGPMRAELESIASGMSIADRIHFVGTSSDISGALSAMDLFALTSHNEASPVSILEAMACSRAVVAPNVGSISQAVIEGKTGFLYESGDGSLAEKRWLEILSDSKLATKLGSAGREHVVEYGSLESMTEGYSQLIESIHISKNVASELPAEAEINRQQFLTDNCIDRS